MRVVILLLFLYKRGNQLLLILPLAQNQLNRIWLLIPNEELLLHAKQEWRHVGLLLRYLQVSYQPELLSQVSWEPLLIIYKFQLQCFLKFHQIAFHSILVRPFLLSKLLHRLFFQTSSFHQSAWLVHQLLLLYHQLGAELLFYYYLIQ